MSHFAKIENGIVVTVIVAGQAFVDSQPGTWVETSYHTKEGAHRTGGQALRKNYAGIGMIYDSGRDAFYSPRPSRAEYSRADKTVVQKVSFDSWILNDDTCQWNPPTPMPDDGKGYNWDETTLSWIVDVRAIKL